jgi:hypothetical protein
MLTKHRRIYREELQICVWLGVWLGASTFQCLNFYCKQMFIVQVEITVLTIQWKVQAWSSGLPKTFEFH